MKLFLDTADVGQIREVHQWGVLAGVTTNPSLIARQGGDFIKTIAEICEIVQGPVSAEVIAQDAPGMIAEGRLLARISEHVVVKLPLVPAGLQACRALSDEGIRTNVTLCFSAPQALLAGLAGATYVSPFMGRVDDVSWDGTELISQIAGVYAADGDIGTQLLAASIRHPLHVVQCALAGADVATIPYNVFVAMVRHPLTDLGNEKFLADWRKVPDNDIIGQMTAWLARRS
jgi:transaldolase